jgi:hypothetical protein
MSAIAETKDVPSVGITKTEGRSGERASARIGRRKNNLQNEKKDARAEEAEETRDIITAKDVDSMEAAGM